MQLESKLLGLRVVLSAHASGSTQALGFLSLWGGKGRLARKAGTVLSGPSHKRTAPIRLRNPNLRDFLRLSNTGAPLGVIAAMATRGQQSRPGRSLAEDGQVQAGSWHFTEAGV